MRSFLRFIFILLLFVTNLIGGQKLSLENLIKDAIENNPSLASKRPLIRSADLAAKRAIVPDDPHFLFRAIGNEVGRQTEFAKERRFKFQQKVHFPGKLRIRKEVRLQDLEFAKSQEIKSYNDLILQTKIIYFELYLNYIFQQINIKNKKIVQRLSESAAAQYKTARGKQADILKAQIEIQMLNDEFVMLQGQEVSIKAMLNAVLNRPQNNLSGEPRVHFHEKINLDYKKLEKIAMESRPEIVGQQALIQKEKKVAKLARRYYFPDIDFEIMIQQRPATQRHAWGVNIGFDIPIWVRQKQKREAQEADSRAVSNMFVLQNIKNMIRANIKSLLAQVDAFDESINLYESAIIPKTIATLESNESNYMVGKGSFLDIIDTRRLLHEAELNYESAKVQREILLSKLENAVGVSLEKIIKEAKK